MPILAAEPNLFPEHLFDPQTADPESERRWRVLHTLPRQEKSLARSLYKTGIPFYLPLIQRRLNIRGRVLTSHIPLFPGYAFLLGSAQERHAALATNRVLHALEVSDQQGLWTDLTQVHQLIASGAPITPEERLVPGTCVEIRSGPLRGLRGKILRTASGQRFVIQVDFIQRGASVLLDAIAFEVVK
jgi:transcription antitermination factor NusG